MTFDAVAVSLLELKVRVLGRGMSEDNAYAVAAMAVARLGMDRQFFAVVEAGMYADGDTWVGDKKEAEK